MTENTCTRACEHVSCNLSRQNQLVGNNQVSSTNHRCKLYKTEIDTLVVYLSLTDANMFLKFNGYCLNKILILQGLSIFLNLNFKSLNKIMKLIILNYFMEFLEEIIFKNLKTLTG